MPSPDPEPRIRALIVDDEPLARDCVRLALRHHADIELAGECGDGRLQDVRVTFQPADATHFVERWERATGSGWEGLVTATYSKQ
jgi:hypothetical protein